MTPVLEVDALLDDPATRVIVCCGAGGVGKPTASKPHDRSFRSAAGVVSTSGVRSRPRRATRSKSDPAVARVEHQADPGGTQVQDVGRGARGRVLGGEGHRHSW